MVEALNGAPNGGKANGVKANGATPLAKKLDADYASYLFPKKDAFGPVTRWTVYRMLKIYLAAAAVGSVCWFFSDSAPLRAFGAGLVFPGAGYLALGGWGIFGFVLNTVFIPVALFGWFWAGIVQFPFGVYIGSGMIAAYKARTMQPGSLLEATYGIAVVASVVFIGVVVKSNRSYATAQEAQRLARNKYIETEVRSSEKIRVATIQNEEPGSRELNEDEISAMRYLINLTRQPLDSWKGFTHRDQFREGAYRYPLYQIVYALSSLQSAVMPNYHGALSEAQRSALEKVLQPSVLYYWALEAFWGRHSLKWDPIKWENIMLSGWYMMALMMYTSTTRDLRYTKPGSLVFKVTPFHSYPHSIHTIMDALVDNWEKARFCLYACEPNWIYSICNLYGMQGALVYDRFFKTNRLGNILPRFKQRWFSDFTNLDGSIVALRSGLVGIQMPIAGACVTASTAVQCAAVFPEYSDQLWAITKREHTERDEKGNTTGLKLETGDHVDAGLYTMHPEALPGKTWVYIAAKEKGDLELASHVADAVAAAAGPLLSDGCGGTYAANNSTLNNAALANARFNGTNMFVNTLLHGPPEYTFQGPLLADAPYPEVVVAKAWSRGEDLDLVLYDGAGKGTFYLRIERLKPGAKYKWEDGVGGEFVADEKGNAVTGVWVDGRTPMHIKPAE